MGLRSVENSNAGILCSHESLSFAVASFGRSDAEIFLALHDIVLPHEGKPTNGPFLSSLSDSQWYRRVLVLFHTFVACIQCQELAVSRGCQNTQDHPDGFFTVVVVPRLPPLRVLHELQVRLGRSASRGQEVHAHVLSLGASLWQGRWSVLAAFCGDVHLEQCILHCECLG